MSSATTGRPLAFIGSIRRATRPSGAPREPVPRSASTITCARARVSAAARGSPTSHARTPLRFSALSLPPASPPISPSGNASRTSGRTPDRLSQRATTKPSPPLPPLPQTTATRAPRGGALSPRSSASIRAAAPRPAFSMRVAPGMPSSVIARRSRRRISSAVNTPCTAATVPDRRRRPGRGSRRGSPCRPRAIPHGQPSAARCAARAPPTSRDRSAWRPRRCSGACRRAR